MLLSLLFSLSLAWASPASVPEAQKVVFDDAPVLSVGERVTIWSDGETVAILSAVGDDGLEGLDFVDERDPTYMLILHVVSTTDPLLQHSQLLLETTRREAPRLRWAGDLDGDGQPDLLLETDQAASVYLSGQADAGQLVGILRHG